MPAGTPAPIIERVHAALVAALRDPLIHQQLLDAGTDPAPGSAGEMAAQIRREIDLTGKLIRSAGIKSE